MAQQFRNCFGWTEYPQIGELGASRRPILEPSWYDKLRISPYGTRKKMYGTLSYQNYTRKHSRTERLFQPYDNSAIDLAISHWLARSSLD
jgi:hypothetical protein